MLYLRNGNDRNLRLALNLDDFTDLANKDKIELSCKLLHVLNPCTGMIPNISTNEEVKFLLSVYRKNRIFKEVYPFCRFGRLVHLTSHSSSIKRNAEENYDPVYEGKFIELYTGKYATFEDMPESVKYKNKAAARLIKNIDGEEYPQSRFFIRHDVWEKLSCNFDGRFVIAWRSLTSATNRRTMLATLLPLVPACQSVQLLQLQETDQMIHILSVFNSIVFDYIVRLKMAGLDLTQAIINQIPVPDEKQFQQRINFKGRVSSVEMHINSRIKALYKHDIRLRQLFQEIRTYEVDADRDRKELIAEIDCLVAFLYSIEREVLKKIAKSFDKYYTSEEVERLF